MSQQNKSIIKLYFTQIDSTNSKWLGKCGKELIQRKNTGWTNLFNHIKSQHPDYENQLIKTPTVLCNFSLSNKITQKGSTIYGWLNWICCGLKPFNFVENDLTRLYTNLSPVSLNTFKKYLELVTKEVEYRIGDLLPSSFCLVLDGWTKNSTHFVGIFASYASSNLVGYETALLAFTPLLTETSFNSKDHCDLLEYVLRIYGKTFQNIVAICGDNAEINKALATRCGVPLIGCASHRFNLAVLKFLEPYRSIIEKVHILMVKLRNLKLSGLLRSYTDLRPILKNETRWSSTSDMVDRYERIKIHLSESTFTNEKSLMDYFLSPRENLEISELGTHLKKFKSVTLALQKENVTIADVRCLFDEVIISYPTLNVHLSMDARIIQSPNFENAIFKIQEDRIHDMNVDEKISVLGLQSFSHDSIIESHTLIESEDFAINALRKRKHERKNHVETYKDTRFLLPTSNLVERLFSLADFTYDDLRQNLSPTNLEMQIFLKANKRLWDEDLVSKVVSKN